MDANSFTGAAIASALAHAEADPIGDRPEALLNYFSDKNAHLPTADKPNF
jgi:hypothetical protein